MGQKNSTPMDGRTRIDPKHLDVIKRWYRLAAAQILKRFLTVWKVFEVLEYNREKEQGDLFYFYQDLMKYMPKQRLGSKIIIEPRKSYALSLQDLGYKEYLYKTEYREYECEPIKFPIHTDGFKQLLDRVLSTKEKIFPPSIVYNILCQSIRTLSKSPNINRFEIAKKSECSVIGDLHGSLEDLLIILHRNGLPKASNPFIFNGDFVDRGENGVEVLTLLLAAFLVYPNAVYLNRGNHEDCNMNDIYGFTEEIKIKYPSYFQPLIEKISELYRWLPLATIVNDKVFIVHGGISNSVKIKFIDSISRHDYISVLNLPNDINIPEWKAVFDLLWSDPMESYGCVPNSKRNAGVCFGFNVTQNFLQMNKMKYIVRSHECKKSGYDFNHGAKVITIFSSSNYLGPGSNCGAYIKFDTELNPQFFKYMVLGDMDKEIVRISTTIKELEKRAIIKICAHLKANEVALRKSFKISDKSGNGLIHFDIWRSTLINMSGLEIPWMCLRGKLAPKPNHLEVPVNYIYYPSTLDLLKLPEVEEAYENYVSPSDLLIQNKESLEAIFKILDLDGSGEISKKEVEHVVEVLLNHFSSTRTKEDMVKAVLQLDTNKDGKIDLEEFLDGFKNCLKK